MADQPLHHKSWENPKTLHDEDLCPTGFLQAPTQRRPLNVTSSNCREFCPRGLGKMFAAFCPTGCWIFYPPSSQNGAVSRGMNEIPQAAPWSTSCDRSLTPRLTRALWQSKRHVCESGDMHSYAYPASDVRALTANRGRAPDYADPAPAAHTLGVCSHSTRNNARGSFSLAPPDW